MKTVPFICILLLAALAAQPALVRAGTMMQTPFEHYRAFDAQGRPVTIEQVVAALADSDVLFIGETHGDVIAHRLEAELLRRTHERYGARGGAGGGRRIALSLEMFETDVQIVLDEYTSGFISERHFLLSSRPWGNYDTDYRPLVEYARGHGLPVIAANAPARYVNRVSVNGPASLSQLSPQAQAWLPPLPYPPASEAYAAKFRRFLSGEATRAATQHQTPAHGQAEGQQPHTASPQNPHAAPAARGAHGSSFLLDAQNLRDASMGYRISDFLGRNQGALVVHINGTFHSESRLGVPEHLARYRPKTRSIVVTILRDGNFPNFDAARHAGLGDFVILTDPAIPRSRE